MSLLPPAVPAPYLDTPRVIHPAGDALTEGAPQASYGPGSYRARTSIQTAWLDPDLTGADFAQRFVANLPALVDGAHASSATLARGASSEERVVVPSSAQQAVLGVVVGVLFPPAALASSLPSTVPTRWFTVDVSFTASRQWLTDDLNRAIARSFAQAVTSWQSGSGALRAQPDRAPRDGAPLHARLRADNACSGGADWGSVYARACTRIESLPAPTRISLPSDAPVPGPTLIAACAARAMVLYPAPRVAGTPRSVRAGTPMVVVDDGTRTNARAWREVRLEGHQGFVQAVPSDFRMCERRDILAGAPAPVLAPVLAPVVNVPMGPLVAQPAPMSPLAVVGVVVSALGVATAIVSLVIRATEVAPKVAAAVAPTRSS